MIIIVDKICDFLTDRIRKENPDMDEERAEVIHYGIQLIVGEIPKLFIMIGIAFLLGIGKYVAWAYILLLPFKTFSGGFHMKSHFGCIATTIMIYYGNVFISKMLIIETMWLKVLVVLSVWIFGMVMITLYAPADTENVPIISKKERRQKKILSYIALTITLGVSFLVKDNVISNIMIIGILIQCFCITKLAYKLTNNKYGYEVYNKQLA